MGSIIDYIECPNCKHEAYLDFYYKTGEEYTFCQNCGYTKEVTIKNREKTLDILTDEDWDVKENKTPIGAYTVKEYGRVGSMCGSFATTLDMERMKNDVLENTDSIESFVISRFIDGKIISETIVDNGPEIDSAGFTNQKHEL